MIDVQQEILFVSGADGIEKSQSVQSLWSDYGEVKRYLLAGGKYSSIIVKHIQLPDSSQHPKGWNTDVSHQRKLRSYQIERQWYESFAYKTDVSCRVPEIYHVAESEKEIVLIMEDLDACGYPIRLHHNEVSIENAKSCLNWLANFHAKFLNVKPQSLWPIGTYWHLDTRPNEWEQMENIRLKNAAHIIDETLNSCRYQTFLHGDAKLANFCFAENGAVAAVDFQYIGGGCGIKDVAYFISSCFDADDCEKYEQELLLHYFDRLELALDKSIDFQSVKKEWSDMFRFAWADFYRFLDGWSPGHWKMHHYSKKLTDNVLSELEKR